MDAETRRQSLLWGAVLLFHEMVFVDPRAIADQLVNGVRWRFALITGQLPEREEYCRLEGCTNASVADLPNGDAYSDGNPACTRHYLMIKGLFYGIVLSAVLLVAFPFLSSV
jgi:hypothetical protein